MIKLIMKAVSGAVILCIVIGILISIPTIISGYHMYQGAIEKKSIEQKVSEIKSNKDYVKLRDISSDFKKGIVKSEDRRFYHHPGFDIIAICRAAVADVAAGSMVQGGSTITQQLAKNMYFAGDRSLRRKVAEIFVARQLEKKYTKNQILELYCNAIYYGQDCTGLKEATQHYYRLDPKQLKGDQAARLIYTVRCPECYNPATNYNYVGTAN